MWRQLRRWLSPDLAIDLGTSNTRIAVPGEGVVLEEPTFAALQAGTRKILGRGSAVGKLARQMIGRTPDSLITARPIRHGVIADFELCEALLKYFLAKIGRSSPGFGPQVVVTVPGGITPVEQRAVFNSLERAGAGSVHLLESCKAAAIGAGMPISEPLASLICEVGGGTTEIALFSMGEVVARRSLRIGGDDLDEAIVDYLKKHYALRIGIPTAEQLKCQVGSAVPLDRELASDVRGMDVVSGVPRKAVITSEEIRQAIQGPLEQIVIGLRSVMEQSNPELVADLADTGIVLAGGTAQLQGLDLLLHEQFGIPVRIDREPERTVVRGASICVDHLRHWRHLLTRPQNVA